MERAEYNRHSRARVAEMAKDASTHASPDAPERIDHRRRCTRHDQRTVLLRIARERVPTVPHVAKTRRNEPPRIARTAHFERNGVTFICETVHQGFFAEMESICPHSGSNPRLLCLNKRLFWTAAFALYRRESSVPKLMRFLRIKADGQGLELCASRAVAISLSNKSRNRYLTCPLQATFDLSPSGDSWFRIRRRAESILSR